MTLSKFILNCLPDTHKVSLVKVFENGNMRGIRAEVTVRLSDLSERSERHTYWLNSRETDQELEDIQIAIISSVKGVMDGRIERDKLSIRDWQ